VIVSVAVFLTVTDDFEVTLTVGVDVIVFEAPSVVFVLFAAFFSFFTTVEVAVFTEVSTICVFDTFAERVMFVATTGVVDLVSSTPLSAFTIPPIETKLNISDTTVAPAFNPCFFIQTPMLIS